MRKEAISMRSEALFKQLNAADEAAKAVDDYAVARSGSRIPVFRCG
jgi:hypothetical protein